MRVYLISSCNQYSRDNNLKGYDFLFTLLLLLFFIMNFMYKNQWLFELHIDCFNPIIFSNNHSLDLIKHFIIFFNNQCLNFVFNTWNVKYTFQHTLSSCALVFHEMHNLQKLNPKFNLSFKVLFSCLVQEN